MPKLLQNVPLQVGRAPLFKFVPPPFAPIQREGQDKNKSVSFALVGTMNPEEGGLRPQLLDRFGLLVNVKAEDDDDSREKILKTVLDFDEAIRCKKNEHPSEFIDNGSRKDEQHKNLLNDAQKRFNEARNKYGDSFFPENIAKVCVKISSFFKTEGHRSDYVMALAAQAHAAINGEKQVTLANLKPVVPLAIQHRRPKFLQSVNAEWTSEDDEALEKILSNA
ncbi:MAG: hypothetical protein GY749_50255 [Desulfobacteraceae bacterium]|nr:hypothetical protein [Desulfobacteraceae bacterium]